MKKGDKVKVFNNSFNGTNFMEGIAKLVSPSYGSKFEMNGDMFEPWIVVFDEDKDKMKVHRYISIKNKIK